MEFKKADAIGDATLPGTGGQGSPGDDSRAQDARNSALQWKAGTGRQEWIVEAVKG